MLGAAWISAEQKKLDVLAAYAGLYADRVFLPLALDHPDADQHPSSQRESLKRVLFPLLHLKDLIREGLIQPVVTTRHYCSRCAASALSEYEAGQKAAHAQAEAHIKDFRFGLINYEIKGHTLSIVVVTGPEEYLEHGGLAIMYQERPSWAPNKLYTPDKPFRVPVRTVRQHGLVERFFESMSSDAVFNQDYCRDFNAAYLTDLAGEASFLIASTVASPLGSEQQLCAHSCHMSCRYLLAYPLARL